MGRLTNRVVGAIDKFGEATEKALDRNGKLIAEQVALVNETLGGVMAMADDVPTYVPLEEFIENQIIEGSEDMNFNDLIFEHEFIGEVK